MAEIHSTAVVEPGAALADDVVVGPHSFVGDGVVVGAGSRLWPHATVLGPCRLGRNNEVFPYATLGAPPQDRSHQGESTDCVIGDDNVFREQTTVHRGTAKAEGTTRVGSSCLFMVGAHVAHDCVVDDGVTLHKAEAQYIVALYDDIVVSWKFARPILRLRQWMEVCERHHFVRCMRTMP